MAHHPKKKPLSKEEVKAKLKEKQKLSKQKLKEKRAKLIVKNLSFKITADKFKEYFEKYGEIANVELLKKPDGKLKGCGFIQFKLVQNAAKARHYTNGRLLLGRELIVDFAQPKNKFNKEKNKKNLQNDSEGTKEKDVQIKEENDVEIKEEDDIEIKEESEHNENVEGSQKNDEDNSADDSENEFSDEEIENESLSIDNDQPKTKKPFQSHDVVEGKTIFIKNVPFDVSKADLRECMLQFGPVYYALICYDKLTEHSKGTAFVKFVNKEDADKALNAGTELTLLGNVLDCHVALEQNDIHKKIEEKKKAKTEPKDSRNLYLVKEGVILAGTKAAEGVSASDMAKRLQIEQYKTQMLRKLNMFVSKERLVVHNLPPAWDDSKLRTLFQKYAGPGAVIKEARIMRDMKNIEANGVGKSKEYGFVSFSKHDYALTALRNLNNNPNIFSANKRPIIAFSIENKTLLLAKQKRLEKSKLNNTSTGTDSQPREKKGIKEFSKLGRKWERKNKKIKKEVATEVSVPEYSGVTSKPGTKDKMRSRYKLTVQAKLHHENLKKEKWKKKNAKKTLAEKQKEFIKQPKQKRNEVKVNDSFAKLVHEYKKKLISAESIKKSKWYE